jgi:two-component system, sensor histidine kinase and response regulator
MKILQSFFHQGPTRSPQSEDGSRGAGGAQLDKALALSRAGGDEELLREIAVLFLDDYPHIVEQLRVAIAKGVARDIEHHAHSLKGSVSNFGAKEVFEAALTLERNGREGALADVEPSFQRLQTALDRLKPELESLIAG